MSRQASQPEIQKDTHHVHPGVSTFVFEEVAHARAPGQDDLRDILDDLGLLLGRESRKPFGQALEEFVL